MSVTYKPKNKKRFTTHGFLVRMSSPTGKNIIRRRILKGRKSLAPLMAKKLK
jgi:large subunit ribosomal protein L34